MVTDPLLGAVGWTLARRGARRRTAPTTRGVRHRHPGGVRSFGGMQTRTHRGQIEMRASWTPLAGSLGAARRGMGRSALHRGRPAAGADGVTDAAQPTRPARPDDRRGDEHGVRHAPSRRTPTPAPADAAGAAATRRRHRRRRLTLPSPPSLRAPVRSRSTPSGPPATGTPTRLPASSCVARGRAWY